MVVGRRFLNGERSASACLRDRPLRRRRVVLVEHGSALSKKMHQSEELRTSISDSTDGSSTNVSVFLQIKQCSQTFIPQIMQIKH